MSERERIVEAASLELGHLVAMFERRIVAVRIAAWCDTGLAERLSAFLLAEPSLTNYRAITSEGKLILSEQERVGVPLNEAYGALLAPSDQSRSARALIDYQEAALPGIRRLRTAGAPDLGPIDRLRLELDEICPQGAQLAVIQGQKAFAGIGRVVRATPNAGPGDPEPHMDVLPRSILELAAQLSAISYLRVPREGGELEVWDLAPRELQEHLQRFGGLRRAELPPPCRIEPRVGELILINTRLPHAIRPFSAGVRVVVQTFVGLRTNGALCLWN